MEVFVFYQHLSDMFFYYALLQATTNENRERVFAATVLY